MEKQSGAARLHRLLESLRRRGNHGSGSWISDGSRERENDDFNVSEKDERKKQVNDVDESTKQVVVTTTVNAATERKAATRVVQCHLARG